MVVALLSIAPVRTVIAQTLTLEHSEEWYLEKEVNALNEAL